MQGPTFLPEELTYCEACATEEELFQTLTQKPLDLVYFFEVACDDETWTEAHFKLIRSLFRWGAKSFYLGKLPTSEATKMAQAVQKHYAVLNPLLYFRASLFFNAVCVVENQKIRINSLLFGTQSPYFYNRLRKSYEKFSDEIPFSPKVKLDLFRLAEEHLLKGSVSDLWKQEYPVVLRLMHQAKEWGIHSLVKECADVLRRYIEASNVIETMTQAHQGFFKEWKESCYEVFNRQHWGLRLMSSSRPEDLYVEFLDYKEDTLHLFKQVSPLITHLAFGSSLSESPLFGKVIRQCPRLVGVDLSGSTRFSHQDKDLPFDLVELNLSACAWLAPEHLKVFFFHCSDLKRLSLANNIQLLYTAWGHLNKLDILSDLNLARCYQITDEDLKLIARSAPRLTDLDLEECRNFTDQGLAELIQTCHHLSHLNLSRCYSLTDRTLSNLAVYANELSHLSLVRCTNLSEGGLMSFLNQKHNLRYLDIRKCEFSLKFLMKLKRQFPLLQIVD
jgi:F-box and leucine-rich repeat protein 2/20